MLYDLIVVGNGIAAQTLLFELFSSSDVKKSQNYSVAQIFSEDIAPMCSLKSTATVSLNGTEEGISELGDNLRKSFFLFQDFLKLNPRGVETMTQFVTSSSPREHAKLLRRYKQLEKIKHPYLKEEVLGIELDSYAISPEVYLDWFSQQLKSFNITQKKKFLKGLSKNAEGIIQCELMNKEIVSAKKIVFCTGAYTKIFSDFYNITEEMNNTEVVAGSYLERFVDLNKPSFYITIDAHNVVYRSSEKRLIVGSASKLGAFAVSDNAELKRILLMFNQFLNFSLGELSDFKTVTGLRHKGHRRNPRAFALDSEKSSFVISGLYKNGFTFSLMCAKKIVGEIFSQK